ncbi:hypothetical protein MKK50_14255 [Methylobacterium sp. J-043]|nr:hypothetical protein [Methylobacterium sp. J-043]
MQQPGQFEKILARYPNDRIVKCANECFHKQKNTDSLAAMVGGSMLVGARLAICGCLMLHLAACSRTDSTFLREGIGSDLYSAGLPEATHYEGLYVSYICQQADLGAGGVCTLSDSAAWTTFFQAGMNDIDRRCDSYLAWLDDRRRSAEPVLQQIADTGAATLGIMRLSGIGANPITIAGLAFGFAAKTFTNFNSRLLTELNHSTVQTVVLSRQTEFRISMRGRSIRSRPDAVHALRQYLRICMPFTIETEINTAITAFERGGPAALARRNPLVSTAALGTPAAPFRAASSLPRTAGPRVRPPGANTSAERAHETEDLVRIQQLICVHPSGAFDQQTRQGIRILQEALGSKNPSGEISRRDLRVILQQNKIPELKESCRLPHQNFYERTVFRTSQDILMFQKELNRWSAGGAAPESGELNKATRAKIAAVRKVMPGLTDPPGLELQVTPAFRLGVLTPPR